MVKEKNHVTGLNILAVGAHPDDLELLCSGTLAKYVKYGNKVFMYHTCNGDKGGFNRSSESIKAERDAEAKNAAGIIGAESMAGIFEDGNVYINDHSKRVMAEAIRKTRADVIITHNPDDYHTDHINTSKLVTEANYMSTIQNYITESPFLSRVPAVYFMETLGGINFIPELYVDISDTMQTKKKMIAAHKSQVIFLNEHSHLDIIEWMDICGRYRGYQCGAEYAECFTQRIDWPVGKSGNLLPI